MFASVFVFSLGQSQLLVADEYFWTGKEGNAFNDGGNASQKPVIIGSWDDLTKGTQTGVPGALDSAFFGSGYFGVTTAGTNPSLDALTIESGSTLNLGGGGTLSVNTLNLNSTSAAYSLFMEDTNLEVTTVNAESGSVIGIADGATGNLPGISGITEIQVWDGSSLYLNGDLNPQTADNATINLQVHASTAMIYGDIKDANSAANPVQVYVDAGGTLTADNIVLQNAFNTGSSGSLLSVSDANSSVTVNNDLTLDTFGSARVLNGALLEVNEDTIVGSSSGSTGFLNAQDAGTSVVLHGDLAVNSGSNGAGVYIGQGASLEVDGDTTVGAVNTSGESQGVVPASLSVDEGSTAKIEGDLTLVSGNVSVTDSSSLEVDGNVTVEPTEDGADGINLDNSTVRFKQDLAIDGGVLDLDHLSFLRVFGNTTVGPATGGDLLGLITVENGSTFSSPSLTVQNGGVAISSGGVVSIDSGGGTLDLGLNGETAELAIGLGGATSGTLQAATVDTGANAIVDFQQSDTATFSPTIAGTGQVKQDGPGTTVLSGSNSYSGGTILAGGILQISSDQNLGAATGTLSFAGGILETTKTLSSNRGITLNGSGTFQVDAGTTLTQSGEIVGSGALVKTGDGTLVLTNENNFYKGATEIGDGTLQIDSDDELGDNSQAVDFSGGTLQTTEAITSARDMTFTTEATIDVDDQATFTESGHLSGAGGLTKNGKGTLILGGDNDYGGETTLNEGTTTVNGTLSSNVNVAGAGATLGGKGTINGKVTVSSGASTFPGDPQILTATSIEYQTGSTAHFSLGLSSKGTNSPVAGVDYDQINLTGETFQTLQLDSGSVTLQLDMSAETLEALQDNSVSDLQHTYFLFTLGNGSSTGDFSDLALTVGSDTTTMSIVNGLAFDSEDGIAFQVSYDADSSLNSTLGGNDVAVSIYATVPEPYSWILLLGGIAALCAGRRFRFLGFAKE